MQERRIDMPVVKLTFSEEHYKELKKRAGSLSLQDYIRGILFDEPTIFTPEEAITRAKEKFMPGAEFSLPEVYAENWTLDRGPAGAFGKQFYNYLLENDNTGIAFVGMDKYGRRAMYKVIGGERNE